MTRGSDGQLAGRPLLNPSSRLLLHHFALSDLLSQTQDFVKTQNKKKDRPLFSRGAHSHLLHLT